MVLFPKAKTDAAVIRRIFQGEPEAYYLIIERYQPIVYAVALAHTGNVYLADKAVVSAFEEGYGRLASLTDAKKLGYLLCSLAQTAAEHLVLRRTPNWNKLRTRLEGNPPVDLKWVQTELIEPLGEELGSFNAQERKGLLLHAFGGLSAKQIAGMLKIDRKEATDDLARTQENVEKALLKEIIEALDPEINNRERILYILTAIGGKEAAAKVADKIKFRKPKNKLIPYAAVAAFVLVVGITLFFSYRLFMPRWATPTPEQAQGTSSANNAAPDTAQRQTPVPSNYSIQGRVVDERFLMDGIPGLIVEAGGKQAETDFYGSFEIKGVVRGEHDVKIRVGDKILVPSVRMRTDRTNDPVAIRLDESIPARFSLRGKVYDRVTGQLITRFETVACKDFVEMFQPYMLDLFREQQHPEGILCERFITIGDYTLFVRAPGYAPLPLQFTITETWEEQNKLYDFPLYRSAGFIGTVYGANELSVGGAGITPRKGTIEGAARQKIHYTGTNSMGRFEIYYLPVGVQSFFITHLHHGVARAIVDLQPGKTIEARIQFPKKSSLTGDITINRAPAKFHEFRRRSGGGTVDLTKNLNYISPGQYEIVLTPEPVAIVASVSPTASDRWLERKQEREAKVSTSEPTWLDFNFDGGEGSIFINTNLNTHSKKMFAEIIFTNDRGREIFLYELPLSDRILFDKLPWGQGEVILYSTNRDFQFTDFNAVRALMERHSKPFSIDDKKTSQTLEFYM